MQRDVYECLVDTWIMDLLWSRVDSTHRLVLSGPLYYCKYGM